MVKAIRSCPNSFMLLWSQLSLFLQSIRFMGLQSTSYDVEMERNHPKPFKLNSKVNIRHFWSHHPSHFELHLVSTTDRKDARAKCMLTSPKVLWTDDTKLELFGHSDQFYVYRWKNDALKENNTSLLKGVGVVGLGHLAQWTCAGHNERPRLPRWKILQWDNGPKPKKLTALKKGWEINTGLFLNGPPRAGILTFYCTLCERSENCSVETPSLKRALDSYSGRVSQTTCWQMQTSHCEIQRSLYWRSLWSDLWKGINSFVHVCIFEVHCIQ